MTQVEASAGKLRVAHDHERALLDYRFRTHAPRAPPRLAHVDLLINFHAVAEEMP